MKRRTVPCLARIHGLCARLSANWLAPRHSRDRTAPPLYTAPLRPSCRSIPAVKFRHSAELECLVESNLQPAPRPCGEIPEATEAVSSPPVETGLGSQKKHQNIPCATGKTRADVAGKGLANLWSRQKITKKACACRRQESKSEIIPSIHNTGEIKMKRKFIIPVSCLILLSL
jgi:hypothetical protein